MFVLWINNNNNGQHITYNDCFLIDFDISLCSYQILFLSPSVTYDYDIFILFHLLSLRISLHTHYPHLSICFIFSIFISVYFFSAFLPIYFSLFHFSASPYFFPMFANAFSQLHQRIESLETQMWKEIERNMKFLWERPTIREGF